MYRDGIKINYLKITKELKIIITYIKNLLLLKKNKIHKLSQDMVISS